MKLFINQFIQYFKKQKPKKNMKTRIFLVLLIALALFSCQKEKDPATTQDVTFTATQIDPGAGLKGTDQWDWKCNPALSPVYAEIDIYAADGITFVGTFRPAVFYLDGKLYTQAIKFLPGTYIVSKFVVMDDMGTPADLTDDLIYMATPAALAPYSQYTDPDIRFSFVVEAFKKAEIPVQVLCFIPAEYTNFGFDWFVITEIIIREQCFFGDICVKHPLDYTGSNYALQSTGLQIDMPAIFRVDVYKGGVFVESFTNNVAPWGVGTAVCVKYADILGANDVFTFEIWIMVKQGNAFPFVLFKTLTFNNIWNIEDGIDNVYDFVLGSCNLTTPDLLLAPWQNLPPWANVTILNPGTLTSYWDITFNSFNPAGTYDITLGLWPGWCGDEFTTIPNSTFDAAIYTSLNNVAWPAGMPFDLAQISKVNWLFNHLSDFGITTIGAGEGDDLQKAIWNIFRNAAFHGGNAATMYTAASTHGNFVPLPGGWAAVLIIRDNNPDAWQLLFVLVDP
jgi:hypothetical protein